MAEENNKVLGLDFERPVVELEKTIESMKALGKEENIDFSKQIRELEKKCNLLKKEIFKNLTPWQKVQLARHQNRPHTLDYITLLFTDFIELHGDRVFADDKAIITGIGKFEGRSVAIVGHQKGRTVNDNIERNFGMANPEGYRKALRIMHLAERFSLPVISFVDTPGAYPGIGAEERGQAEAIARNLREMSRLKTPIIVIIVGEGGSGGALGIGIGDKVLMLENAIYSVISPEGCASILFRDASKAPQAAQYLKLTANDLLEFGVIDEILPEPLGGAHRDMKFMKKVVSVAIEKSLKEVLHIPIDKLLETRYMKFRQMGKFIELEKEKFTNKKGKSV